jgi:hypothetical protein
MSPIRPAAAVDPRIFGRGMRRNVSPPPVSPSRSILSDELKLFGATFLCGFVFVSIYLA